MPDPVITHIKMPDIPAEENEVLFQGYNDTHEHTVDAGTLVGRGPDARGVAQRIEPIGPLQVIDAKGNMQLVLNIVSPLVLETHDGVVCLAIDIEALSEMLT